MLVHAGKQPSQPVQGMNRVARGCKQAERGAFSAYAYETLPIMHTLMSQSELGAEQFAADCLAFFDGYAGHINADMRRWTAAVKAGAQGAEAAVDGDAAHALIKVQRFPSHTYHSCWSWAADPASPKLAACASSDVLAWRVCANPSTQ